MTADEMQRLVESSLRRLFRKPPVGLLARLLGSSREYSYSITDITPHASEREFKCSTVLSVTVEGYYLPIALLPGDTSRGVFSITDGECYCLHPAYESTGLQKLFAAENAIAHMKPDTVALLFCDAMHAAQTKYRLLRSNADFRKLSADEAVVGSVAPPVWSQSSADGSYTLDFSALAGSYRSWSLRAIAAHIAPDSNINLTERVLIDRVPTSDSHWRI